MEHIYTDSQWQVICNIEKFIKMVIEALSQGLQTEIKLSIYKSILSLNKWINK